MIRETTSAADSYRAEFDRLMSGNTGTGPFWLSPLRQAAFSRFEELGFPTRRNEEWRFTSVAPIVEAGFQAAAHPHILVAEELAQIPFGDLPCNRLVFVNGVYAPELSEITALPNGVQIGSLADALRAPHETLEAHLGRHAAFEKHSFVALNTALFVDGAFVYIPRHCVVEEPIQILFIATEAGGPTFSHPRNLFVAEANSQATLIETYVDYGNGVTFTNAVTEVVLAEYASIDHYKVTQESDQGYHIATMQIQQAQRSVFTSHNITLAGALVRNDHNATLGGENISTTLNGLYLARGRQLIDNHTAIDHVQPHCESHEIYKGILEDRARGVFNGKIFVRPDAQKTDAKQTNQTLLLSDEAVIDTKPQLEIYADDVKCTHGATVGQLDKDLLFYLRARGVDEATARALLIYAFASDIIDRVKVDALRETIYAQMFARLPQGFQTEDLE